MIARIWKERGSRESLLGQSCDLQLVTVSLSQSQREVVWAKSRIRAKPLSLGFQLGKSMISSWAGQQFPAGMANGFHLGWPMVSSWVGQWFPVGLTNGEPQQGVKWWREGTVGIFISRFT